MPFVSSLKRLLASLAAIFHNRLELASIEVEEATLRLQQSIMLSLCALLCGFLALCLVVVLCIVLFWDTYRVAVISGFIALFSLACLGLLIKLRHFNEAKPALLAATLAELRKDIQVMQETSEKTPPPGN